MLRQNSSCINWHLLLVGLFFVILRCDARAVNVSNTWTMPQEGLNVFYRFFRDRISWFEADAVCQFHHANLVTVDNSFQFDATRDLLRELDVNDIVWIGLMRPQSSDRFMWSSTSRPLVADTGYWAESLPLMDAPLCAVIDPIRDYRWHALRCGGPETASFLCEMPVPIWADACNLKDMPNLTLQYMADTASIELIRNCQEEGLLRTMCRGKQDRERALQDLVCPRERLEAQRINDITNSHFKSLQIINSIPSDNNENNDIELMPMEVNYGPHFPEELQTEKNTVQRLIEQFNVDELMQADEPSNIETVSSFYKIPDLIPKPVKKSAKKVLDFPKKDNDKQQNSGISMEKLQKNQKRLPVIMEEMMMGDQPVQGEPEIPEQFLNEEVSNEILEPLPHIKKTNIHKEDGLEKMEKEAIAMKKSMQKNKEIENKKLFMMSMATTTTQTTPTTESETTITTTTTNKPILITKSTTEIHITGASAVPEEIPKQNEDYAHEHSHENNKKIENTGAQLTTVTSPSIGHPIHPQQPRSNVITEESQHSHMKEAADNSHFIPPMLMVKSHYIPSASKHGHSEHDHHHQQHQHHDIEKSQIEKTTKEQAATKIKQEQNQTFDMVTLMPTTPKLLDSQKTTLKILDTLKHSKENEKQFDTTKQQEHQTALTTAEADSSMKSITEQHTTETETEQHKNSKILYFEEKQTTKPATTSQPDASTSAKHIVDDEMILLTSNSEGINKNIAGHGRKEGEIPKFKPTQKTDTDDDTNQTTKLAATTEKSLTFTEKLYNLETTTDYKEKTEAIADDTKTVKTSQQEQEQEQTQPQQQHELTMEEKLTAIKIEENKEHLKTTTGTTEKQAAIQTAEVITTSTTVSALAIQETPKTTTKIEAQNLQQIVEDQANKEKLQEDEKKVQEKKEAIVKTTEIQVTSTSALLEAKQNDAKTTITTSAAYTPAISTSITTTTTVKPITTTLPQNEIKSTDTSFSSTNTIARTTKNLPTSSAEDTAITTTTTIMPPTSTSSSIVLLVSSPVTITKTIREIKTESTTAPEPATATATSTQTSSTPETTRNFLKVTTEIPFKPNRRRSLTKPETVSYMKKILG